MRDNGDGRLWLGRNVVVVGGQVSERRTQASAYNHSADLFHAAEHAEELRGRYEAKVLPALEASEGWRGAQLLYDETNGTMMTVNLWEDGEVSRLTRDPFIDSVCSR